jgi:hypothetical protein
VKIELKDFKDNPDGSANCVLDVDKEGMETMMRVALKALLEMAIASTEEFKLKEYEYDDSGTSVGDSERGSIDSGDGESKQSSQQTQPGDSFKTSQVSG